MTTYQKLKKENDELKRNLDMLLEGTNFEAIAEIRQEYRIRKELEQAIFLGDPTSMSTLDKYYKPEQTLKGTYSNGIQQQLEETYQYTYATLKRLGIPKPRIRSQGKVVKIRTVSRFVADSPGIGGTRFTIILDKKWW